MFGGYYRIFMQGRQRKHFGTIEEGQGDVNSVFQYCFVTNAGSYGEREFKCGQFCLHHSYVNGFQTEGGIIILHFISDSFDIVFNF